MDLKLKRISNDHKLINEENIKLLMIIKNLLGVYQYFELKLYFKSILVWKQSKL